MSLDTGICNLAISHIGVGKTISNANTESSEEAITCRVFYEIALKATLRDCEWPFATELVTLGLITANPSDDWGYSYTYPPTAVKIRHIYSGVRKDSLQSQVEYKIYAGSSSREIYCDLSGAKAETTKYIENTAFYPDDFKLAFSYRLANYLVPKLSRGDQFNIKKELFALYEDELSMAQANSFNEIKSGDEVNSEFVRAREGNTDEFKRYGNW